MIMPAVDVERILKEKFLRDYPILGSSVLEIRTSICQNNCSGIMFIVQLRSERVNFPRVLFKVMELVTVKLEHVCVIRFGFQTYGTLLVFMSLIVVSPYITFKICKFVLTYHLLTDWSILYVLVGVAFTFILISGLCLAITYFCRKRRSVKKWKKNNFPHGRKYSPLDTQEEETSTNCKRIYLFFFKPEAFCKSKIFTDSRHNGNSFSESDTESDILFTRSRNGILKSNGDNTKFNGKYSMTRLGRKIKA